MIKDLNAKGYTVDDQAVHTLLDGKHQKLWKREPQLLIEITSDGYVTGIETVL